MSPWGHPGRRSLVAFGWIATAVLAAVIGAWAARTTLEPPAAATNNRAPVLYTVSDGTVGRVVSFTAEARWRSVPLGRNAASGTVTTVDVDAGDMVRAGQRLYTVDLRPVIAAEGVVPAFRDLGEGAQGADVSQLQRFLTLRDYYNGPVDGDFGSSTTWAVYEWQEALGVEVDGVVRRGDLLFVPELPARVTPVSTLEVGLLISPSQPAFERLSKAPTFTVTLDIEQQDLVPLVTTVRVHHADGTWRGSIASSTATPMGQLVLTLEGRDGDPLCGDRCGLVPIRGSARYRADLVVVPNTTGPIVPASALSTTPDGTATVVTEDGRAIEVEVLAAAEGRAVVSGVEAGTAIRLFGEAAGRSSSNDSSGPP